MIDTQQYINLNIRGEISIINCGAGTLGQVKVHQ
jgi:hypothetical protein